MAKEMEIEIDIVGDLDEKNLRDRFQIMQNKKLFIDCFFLCITYLFTKNVSGFFKPATMEAIIRGMMFNIFDSSHDFDFKLPSIMVDFANFGFIEFEIIGRNAYIKSKATQDMFDYCFKAAEEFCEGFAEILDAVVMNFKQAMMEHDAFNPVPSHEMAIREPRLIIDRI